MILFFFFFFSLSFQDEGVLYQGIDRRQCVKFMLSLLRDPYPLCSVSCDRICTRDSLCDDVCSSWTRCRSGSKARSTLWLQESDSICTSLEGQQPRISLQGVVLVSLPPTALPCHPSSIVVSAVPSGSSYVTLMSVQASLIPATA